MAYSQNSFGPGSGFIGLFLLIISCPSLLLSHSNLTYIWAAFIWAAFNRNQHRSITGPVWLGIQYTKNCKTRYRTQVPSDLSIESGVTIARSLSRRAPLLVGAAGLGKAGRADPFSSSKT
jgi:hypothetical protein